MQCEIGEKILVGWRILKAYLDGNHPFTYVQLVQKRTINNESILSLVEVGELVYWTF